MLLYVFLALLPLPTTAASTSASASASASTSALARARGLPPPPPPVATTGGEHEGAAFFEAHADVLRDAWRELGLAPSHAAMDVGVGPEAGTGGLAAAGLVDPALAAAVASVREAPSALREAAVRGLWHEEAPGVWSSRLLSLEAIAMMRDELVRVRGSGIPTRRPNGMNRFGVILDEDVPGAVRHGLATFVKRVIDEYVRPVGRMLFPEFVRSGANGAGSGGGGGGGGGGGQTRAGDDAEQFAFTVRYTPGQDVKLAEHRDASVVTLNLNLNLPGEGFGGSALYFVDEHDPSVRRRVDFAPGMALSEFWRETRETLGEMVRLLASIISTPHLADIYRSSFRSNVISLYALTLTNIRRFLSYLDLALPQPSLLITRHSSNFYSQSIRGRCATRRCPSRRARARI